MVDPGTTREIKTSPIPLFVDQRVLPETIDLLVTQRGGLIHPEDYWQYKGKEWSSFESTDQKNSIKIIHSVSESKPDDVKLRALQINRKIQQLQLMLDCQEKPPLTFIVDPTSVKYRASNSGIHGYAYDRFNDEVWLHSDAFYSGKLDAALVEAIVNKAYDKKFPISSLLTNGFRSWAAWQIKDESERQINQEHCFDYRSKRLASYFQKETLNLETSIPEWLWDDFGGTLIDVIYQSMGDKKDRIGSLWKIRDPNTTPAQWIASLGLDAKVIENRWLHRLYDEDEEEGPTNRVQEMVDWAKQQAMLGVECGRRFTQLGTDLTPPGQEFDTVQLKREIHRRYIESIIPNLIEGDKSDLRLYLDRPKDFFDTRGVDRLTQILFNPENKLLKSLEGQSISFIEYLNNYFQPLGIVFETVEKEYSHDEIMAMVVKAMVGGGASAISEDVITKGKKGIALRIKTHDKTVEIPVYSTKEKLHEDDNDTLTGAMYIPGSIGGRTDTPMLLLSFWSNYTVGDTASLFSPLLDDFAKIAHEASHVAADVSQDNHFAQKEERLRQYEKDRQRLQDIVFGRELPTNHQEKGELLQRMREIKDRVWQDNIISEGAAETARVALLQAQATGFQVSGNTEMGKACEYLAQRHRWKYQYSNGDDKDMNVYPVGLVLGQIVTVKLGSEAFLDIFYRNKTEQHMTDTTYLSLVDVLKDEIGLVAREVKK